MSMSGESALLSQQVQQALARRDGAGALALIRQAEAARPDDIDIKMQKALALRVSGDLKGAIAALDQALALAPYHFVALLSKGALVEQAQSPRHAAAIYKNALKILPSDPPTAFLARTRNRYAVPG